MLFHFIITSKECSGLKWIFYSYPSKYYTMFFVDQLNQFQETNPEYKLIKPWWDVLISYLAAALLAIAVLAGVMQATQSNLVCLPAVDCKLSLNQSLNTSEMNNFCRGRYLIDFWYYYKAPGGGYKSYNAACTLF